MNGPDLDKKARLREWHRALVADLITLLGREHRDELERMTVEQLIRTKGRTMAELMQPGPTAA